MTINNSGIVFDYRALRLLVGLIAFALPFVVSLISSSPLSSISASYHTEARDAFVGMLFIVGAFLWAYNGHTPWQARTSKIASLAAILLAIFPTSYDIYKTDIKAIIHYCAAAILFAILAYFCFGPFRKNTKGQKGKKGIRSKIYFTCGCIMVACMLGLGLMEITISDETLIAFKVTYWAEVLALGAFGIAWIIAGKYFRPFVDKYEALQLFK